MPHVIGMVERMIKWLKEREGVEFWKYEDIAREWRAGALTKCQRLIGGTKENMGMG